MAAETVDPLFVELYPRLRSLARSMMRGERLGHTLESSALVNEAFTGLLGKGDFASLTSAQFFCVAAKAMRHVLVDHARRRNAAKRDGGRRRVTLVDEQAISDEGHLHGDVVERIHELLDELAGTGPVGARQARVFELRAFLGLDFPVVATALACSIRSVFNDWTAVRAWLLMRLDDV